MLGVRPDEIFHLHLLKLARAKDEVAGRDLISERLADLRDPKWNLAPHGGLNVEKIDENTLCSLGPQVGQRGWIVFISGRAQGCAKHHVEWTRFRQIA